MFRSGGNTNQDWEERVGTVHLRRWRCMYSRTLKMLSPGNRVWVNIPRTGYVGVGIVRESVVPIDEFYVDGGDGKMVPITSLPIKAARNATFAEKPDIAEYFVRVEWIKTVPVEQAVKERGCSASNTVARPRDMKWVRMCGT